MESVAHICNQGTLLSVQVKLGVDVAIYTLTSLTTDGDDSCIGTIHLFIHTDRIQTDLRIFLLSEVLVLVPLGRMTLSLEFYSCKLDILAIDVSESLARFDAGILQTLQHVNHIRWVNTTRTGTTAQEVV